MDLRREFVSLVGSGTLDMSAHGWLGRSSASLRPRHTIHPEHKRVLAGYTSSPAPLP